MSGVSRSMDVQDGVKRPDAAADPPTRGIFTADVVENRPLCREHYALRLRLPWFPPTRPGQFVQVLCGPDGSDPALTLGRHPDGQEWTDGRWPEVTAAELPCRTAFLRRPFSLAGRHDLSDGGVELELIHRVVGVGTRYLAALEAGDTINLLGPLGNAFPLPGEEQIVLLVGGGVGIPPMIYLAQALCRPRVIAFCGAQTRELLSLTVTNDAPPPRSPTSVQPLYNIAEFSRYGVPCVVSTDDGSYGFRGYVTAALEAYLDRFFTDTWDIGSKRPVVYTCGPEVMMKKVAEMCLQRGLTAYAAVERAMACGLGTCQSCCIRVKSPQSPDGWRYALSCTEGPVFETTRLLW